MAKVELTREAEKDVDALPKAIRLRLLKVVRRLEKWPDVSGAKPLRGSLAARFRVRTGDYRVQFYLDGNIVVIEKVGHRDRFYED
ncbi:MAG TPA: type II toxin-antitoxin system RelE/ParE family toxin [Tepidisphaeraceae bacterium]|jgi:mRNA-degrading endonuclease RelE of RelBE toxin-antitoxin system